MVEYSSSGNVCPDRDIGGLVSKAENLASTRRASISQNRGGKATVLILLLCLLTGILYSGAGLARDGIGDIISSELREIGVSETFVYTSLYTTHYDPDPDHVNDQKMLGLEFQTGNKRLWGLAMFDNSFGQDSQYLYLGKKWRAFSSDRWYYKLTGGLLHGYKEPYDDKVPLNDLGVAPAIIPSLGYRHKSFYAEFIQLGLSAGMITVGFSF
jgi:hypothetical protein